MKIGIIGGTGLDDPQILHNRAEYRFNESEVKPTASGKPAEYGNPSDILVTGDIEGVECVLLARHGRKHEIGPSAVNYRANLLALKQVGCNVVIATHSAGSLIEQYKPGDFVLLDQIIDRTQKRHLTYFDNKPTSWEGVCHTSFGDPYDLNLREVVLEASGKINFPIHPEGTCVAIEGPRFSSRAESVLYRQWGGQVIGMTQVPEAQLAKELNLPFCAVAMVTDYDAWRSEEKPVTVEEILKTIKDNGNKMINFLKDIIPIISHAKHWDLILEPGAGMIM